jgi:hypothetical protein
VCAYKVLENLTLVDRSDGQAGLLCESDAWCGADRQKQIEQAYAHHFQKYEYKTEKSFFRN